MSRNKLFVLATVCVIIMCISGIYAFTNTTTVSVKNELNTSGVNIELEEYTLNNGAETKYTQAEQLVMPGEKVSLIPRIKNLGEPVYVRSKISYSSKNNEVFLSDKSIKTDSENWIRQGEYWYYKKPIETNSNVDIFYEIEIPNLTNEWQGTNTSINIIAEAIQEKNFKPNFDSNNPWGEVDIEKNDNESFKTDKTQISSGVKVDYENSASKYIKIPDDFFAELSSVMPGDSLKEEVKINTLSSESVEYFFKISKNASITEKEENLLKNLQLKITSKGKVIFEGSLYQLENVSLGKFGGNVEETLEFTITAPKSLGNSFSMISTLLNWDFSVKVTEKEPVKEPEKSPQTGDVKIKITIAIFIIAALLLIIILILERKNKKEENDK